MGDEDRNNSDHSCFRTGQVMDGKKKIRDYTLEQHEYTNLENRPPQ